ncbi:MAG: FecR domain-containing protein [Pseudomonadota bacterium]
MRFRLLIALGALMLAVWPIDSVWANQIGEVVAARGAASAQGGNGAGRLLGRGSAVHAGDVLTTGSRSFLIVKFIDDTRMTLRPDTVFRVDEWNTSANQESAVSRLFKGGLRAITGFITKRNSRAFRVNTSVATIGIRGTTFDARLCEGDCAADVQASGDSSLQRSQAVGRAGFVRGEVEVRRDDADYSRVIEAGSPLYEGDTIATADSAFAVLVMSDRGRVTLRANTEFKIESMKYSVSNPEQDSQVFRLLRGGLRAITGLIGKRNANRVKYRTSVATIGIRGTGFDMVCIDACGDGTAALEAGDPLDIVFKALIQEAHAADGLAPGLVATPFLNTIYAELNGQVFEIPEGIVGYIAAAVPDLQILPQNPVPFDESQMDGVIINEEQLFDTGAGRDGEPGLHVACIEGTACAVGDDILAAGESSYTSSDGDVQVRTEYAAPFLVEDKYFRTVTLPADVIDHVFNPDSDYDAEDPGSNPPGECIVGG